MSTTIFQRAKFISNEGEKIDCTTTVYDLIFTKEEKKEHGAGYKAKWVNTCSGQVLSDLNEKRGYIQQRMRDAVEHFAKKNDNRILTKKEILRCIMRDIDWKNEDDQKIFEWYWVMCCGKWPSAFFFLPKTS